MDVILEVKRGAKWDVIYEAKLDVILEVKRGAKWDAKVVAKMDANMVLRGMPFRKQKWTLSRMK